MRTKELRIEQGLCPECGNPKDRDGYMCSGCLRVRSHQARERKCRTKYKNASLDEICIRAKEAGLSYGKYLARYGE